MALTGLGVQLTANDLRRNRHREFDILTRDARTALERRVASYSEALFGLRSLYATQRPLSRDRFHSFVTAADIGGRFRGIQALSFNRRVARADAIAFERNVRKDVSVNGVGYPDFSIHPRTDAPELFVVEYIEPLEGNEAAFGFDLGSDATRLAAIRESRDSGDLVATRPIKLVQEAGEQKGFLLFLAVYSTEDLPLTAAARRRRFEGVMVGVFRIRDMLSGVLGSQSRLSIEEIYDVGRTVESKPQLPRQSDLLMDATGKVSALRPGSLPELHRFLDVNVGSRRWRILIVPGPVRIAQPGRFVPWIVGVTGLLLDLLLAGLLFSFARSRARAENEARRLQEVSEMKSAFMTSISHEIRTPLTTIVGMTETLRRHLDRLSPERARILLEAASANADRLEHLLANVIDVDRLLRGVIEPRPLPVDVSELVARLIPKLDVGLHDVQLDTTPVTAHLDPALTERIVEHLFLNVIKYCPERTRVWVRLRREEEGVLITVEDEGPGVPEHLREAIFEPFRQGRTVEHSPGMGVGLAIVAQFAKLHGGRAWVQERAGGGGASFKVLLPDRAPAATIAPGPPPTPA